MKLFIVGFGGVGKQMAAILLSNLSPATQGAGDMAKLAKNVKVVAITTGSHGCLYNPKGIDLLRALSDLGYMINDGKLELVDSPNAGEQRGFKQDNPDLFSSASQPCATPQLLEKADFDVLVELSPLNIRTGEPAISYIRRALIGGKHVVTANKGPVAHAFSELYRIAKNKGKLFRFESSVMDGAPIFNMARASLRGCVVKGVKGILNSTCNYVLSELEKGVPMKDAIVSAQKAGVAEADPDLDLEGWDASAKICALANVLMGAHIRPQQVQRESIKSVSIHTAQAAVARGVRIKQVARVERVINQDGECKLQASVLLEEVPTSDTFALVSGLESIVSLETDLMAPVTVLQGRRDRAPNLIDTAAGVLTDLIDILGVETQVMPSGDPCSRP